MNLPEVGSVVYAVFEPERYADGRPGVSPAKVIATYANQEGIVGAWFSADVGWKDRGYLLSEEGVTWTRAVDADAHQAVLAAYALRSC